MKVKINKRDKKGVIVALVALMIPIIIGFAAYAIDLAQVYSVESRIKSAVDLAAAAGQSKLSRHISAGNRISDAKNEVVTFLNTNLSQTIPGFTNLTLSSPELTIQAGIYEPATGVFTWDETNANAVNALMIEYTYTLNSKLSGVFSIDNFEATSSVIATKTPSGYATAGTVTPFAIDESTLNNLPGGTVEKRIYLSQAQQNWYLTAYDNMADALDIADGVSYTDTMGTIGTAPPKIEVGDTFAFQDDEGTKTSIATNYLLTSALDDGAIFVIPVVSRSGTDFTVKGFIGASIWQINLGGMGFFADLIFQPGYIDDNWKGTKIGSTPTTITTDNQEFLAQSVQLVK